MAKYKIGDKVKVRCDLKLHVDYCMCDGTLDIEINREMKDKGGATVTIKGYDSNGRYLIEEDEWHWTDEMFNDKNDDIYVSHEEICNLKPGDKVRVRDDLEEDEYYYMYKSSDSQLANSDMIERAGEVVTIKDYDSSGCYYIEEDIGENLPGKGWHWTDEMFSEKLSSHETTKISNLKVGDKVIVRPDLDIDKKYADANGCNRTGVNSYMCDLKGTVVTIKTVNDHDYHIEEDDGDWWWTDEMFSERVEEVIRKFKVGDIVRFRSDLFVGMSIFSEEGKSLKILSQMSKYAGQEAVITGATDASYSVDTNLFCWYAGAFEDKIIDKSISGEGKEIKTKPPFKAGDKVLVREDLEKGKFYNNVSTSDCDAVTEPMLNLRGKVCTIEGTICDKYCLIEDVHNYRWTEEMFVLDEYPSEKAKEQPEEEKKEDKPSLLEYQIEHQHDIPKRLFYLAEKYPNVTWKKAKAYYAKVVDNVVLGAGEENLFSGSLSFGRGLNDAAARFEELLKLEESAVSLVGTVATFEDVPVVEDKTPKPVSNDEGISEKINCFSCTRSDCFECDKFKYKMAIT